MSIVTFSLKYYEDKITQYEQKSALSEADVYEAKQLLKVLEDVSSEGHYDVKKPIEQEYNGVSRLTKLIVDHGEAPFRKIRRGKSLFYNRERIELSQFIDNVLEKAEATDPEYTEEIKEIVNFSKWIDYDENTAYIFLLRGTLLPYLWFKKQGRKNLYPWCISRKFMNYISPKNYIDDVVRAAFFDALDAGLEDFDSFKLYCQRRMLSQLEKYPEVTRTLKELLDSISAEKIVIVETGHYGSFPMLLSALDDRVDFRMFTTVPYLKEVYGDRIYTTAYEKDEAFKQVKSQEELFQFSSLEDGHFYVQKTADGEIEKDALKEIKAVVSC